MSAELARAVAHHRSGRLRQAERACTKALGVDPQDAGAWHLMGMLAVKMGNPALGASFIGQALRIRGPVADWYVHLGRILEQDHNLPGAAACYRQALDTDDRDAQTAFRLGNLLTQCGQLDEAAIRYRHAVQQKPEFPEAWFNLGVVSAMQGRVAEAMTGYRRAIAIQPDYSEAQNNLGILLHAHGRWREAGDAYEHALRVQPGYVAARYNLAVLRQREDRLTEAEAEYRRVIHSQPSHVEAHNNLGNALLAMNRAKEARTQYRRALSLEATHAEANWNLGVVDLLLGNFADGWRGYENRLQQRSSVRRYEGHPMWDGQPLDGRRLLIWAEQGLGDTIQFVRLLRQCRGGEVILQCQRPLASLLRTVEGIDRIAILGESVPEFDVHLPVMSLPRVLGLDLPMLPGTIPYIRADREKVLRWRERLAAYDSPHTGIAWSGNPGHANDRNRSLDPRLLVPLFDTAGTFFTVQPDAVAPDRVVSLAGHLTDFGETAALMEALDLVIGVDTSVIHLAGAMNRPAWTLLPFAPDWRWMLDRDDSPWYPSMRLFRQSCAGDWEGAIARVKSELMREQYAANQPRTA